MTDTVWAVVGIPEPDGQVYEALTLRGQASIAELAAELGIPRTRVSQSLSRLAARGLATHLHGRPVRFAAVMPDIAASELIATQESQLRRLREYAYHLAATRRASLGARDPAELLDVIEGAVDVHKAFVRLQREAQNEMRVFDKPPYTTEQWTEGNLEEYRLLGEGQVRYRTLYERAALAQPERMAEVWSGIRQGERARVARSLPMKMALCDNRLALIPVSMSSDNAGEASYLLRPSSLLDALSELFEAMWDKAVPLNQRPASDDEELILTDRERDLLGLLAAGTTDETIARTFGWSVRTVRRHIHRIMTMTGAETRFQAGMEASRRGWLLCRCAAQIPRPASRQRRGGGGAPARRGRDPETERRLRVEVRAERLDRLPRVLASLDLPAAPRTGHVSRPPGSSPWPARPRGGTARPEAWRRPGRRHQGPAGCLPTVECGRHRDQLRKVEDLVVVSLASD
ncbi:MAG: helix-turn-helix transcriptional regulator [Streptosporangiaceae bacterium]